jgi:hypothetical protein
VRAEDPPPALNQEPIVRADDPPPPAPAPPHVEEPPPLPVESREESIAKLEKAYLRARGESATSAFMKRIHSTSPSRQSIYEMIEILNKESPYPVHREFPDIPIYRPEELPDENMETTMKKHPEIHGKLFGKATIKREIQFIADGHIRQSTLQCSNKYYTDHPEELERLTLR